MSRGYVGGGRGEGGGGADGGEVVWIYLIQINWLDLQNSRKSYFVPYSIHGRSDRHPRLVPPLILWFMVIRILNCIRHQILEGRQHDHGGDAAGFTIDGGFTWGSGGLRPWRIRARTSVTPAHARSLRRVSSPNYLNQ